MALRGGGLCFIGLASASGCWEFRRKRKLAKYFEAGSEASSSSSSKGISYYGKDFGVVTDFAIESGLKEGEVICYKYRREYFPFYRAFVHYIASEMFNFFYSHSHSADGFGFVEKKFGLAYVNILASSQDKSEKNGDPWSCSLSSSSSSSSFSSYGDILNSSPNFAWGELILRRIIFLSMHPFIGNTSGIVQLPYADFLSSPWVGEVILYPIESKNMEEDFVRENVRGEEIKFLQYQQQKRQFLPLSIDEFIRFYNIQIQSENNLHLSLGPPVIIRQEEY